MEDVGLDYWLRWQAPVCALIFLLPALVSLRFIVTKNNTYTTKNHHLWMSCWRNLHPCWLLLYRLISFFSMAYLLYQTVLAFGPFVFYFYTHLGPLYLLMAAGCCGPFQIKRETSFSKAGFWGNLMQNIYQTCAGGVVLTDLVFWCLLLPFQSGDDFKLTLLIGCMHSLNAVFLLLDSALNSLQFTWHGLTYFVLWSSAYIIFQWVMHACCFTWWPYPFLEIATPWAPLWYFGIALVHIPCYGLYVWLVKVKASVFPHAYIRVVVANEKQM